MRFDALEICDSVASTAVKSVALLYLSRTQRTFFYLLIVFVSFIARTPNIKRSAYQLDLKIDSSRRKLIKKATMRTEVVKGPLPSERADIVI